MDNNLSTYLQNRVRDCFEDHLEEWIEDFIAEKMNQHPTLDRDVQYTLECMERTTDEIIRNIDRVPQRTFRAYISIRAFDTKIAAYRDRYATFDRAVKDTGDLTVLTRIVELRNRVATAADEKERESKRQRR